MRYLFEEYALDVGLRELRRGQEVVPVAPQVFDLIEYLVRERDRVVSKDELIQVIWNGRIVSDAALTTRLNVARNAIGDSGEQQRLIRTLPRKGFRFVGQVREADTTARAELAGDPEGSKPVLPLPLKPSIAVLPFVNLSSDPEQEHFADGVVEDITMALSLFRWLFVIARNSSFTYKGRTVDVKQVGRDLGVRYILEGSVRKAGNRLRIAGQLIDAETGAHLWADRFEGALEDVFELQDHVTSRVVGAIAPKLQQEEIKRARHKPTENLDARDYYLRGMAKARWWSREANSDALKLFSKAIKLDPRLSSAYGMAAWCYARRKANGWTDRRAEESAEGVRLARKGVQVGADDPVALCMGGYVLAFVAREFDDAAMLMEQGLAVNPNYALGWMLSAWLRVWRGESDLALDHVARAMRLNPLDPSMYGLYGAMAYAHFIAGRYDVAASYAEKVTRDNPILLLANSVSAASSALAGRLDQAQQALARVLACDRGLRASSLTDLAPFRRAEDADAFARGLRHAGLAA
ncbi:winged helix-turn-helix domain-containing tetratricopeptide repeat protein [Bradyrhizobium sp. NP1]|uniref:winged helix-turn-helix domain-containing tetratricopeptide repeat protein n=1 Tax=Bradyrhizobium sp. NP1 TaxID=3049772 RepID=UPI0025A516BD|nr:winged helix-turn-helix domain-containing tetratricopeptide repeat protein [Bradyrhizobium sp. NP1]WJR80432.1 winged helix-turn-helix domain-containing tetratricopeptide repeat protein [Bradyrhizobium sp. NP1]